MRHQKQLLVLIQIVYDKEFKNLRSFLSYYYIKQFKPEGNDILRKEK